MAEQSGAEGLFMGLLFAGAIFVAGIVAGVGLSVLAVWWWLR